MDVASIFGWLVELLLSGLILSYIGIGIFVAFVSFVAMLSAMSERSYSRLTWIAGLSSARHLFVEGLVDRSARLHWSLFMPSRALAWPREMRPIPWNGILYQQANRKLYPKDAEISVTTVSVVMITWFLATRGLIWEWVGELVVWYCLVTVVARLMSYLVGSLVERLRPSPRDPVAQAFCVAVFDALCLTLALCALKNQFASAAFDRSILLQTANEIFNVPRQLSDFASLSDSQIAQFMLGLLYSLTVAKTIFGQDQLRRSDLDFRNTANCFVTIGDSKNARAWLDREGAQTSQSHAIRAKIYLSEGSFKQAYFKTELIFKVENEEHEDVDVCWRMLNLASSLQLSVQRRTRLLAYFRSKGCSDSFLAVSVMILSRPDSGPILEDAELSSWRQAGYPLTAASVLLQDRQIETVVEILAPLRYSEPEAEAWRLTLVCIALLAPDFAAVGAGILNGRTFATTLEELLPLLDIDTADIKDHVRVALMLVALLLTVLIGNALAEGHELADAATLDRLKERRGLLASSTDELERYAPAVSVALGQYSIRQERNVEARRT